jgi:hypothetical protein
LTSAAERLRRLGPPNQARLVQFAAAAEASEKR